MKRTFRYHAGEFQWFPAISTSVISAQTGVSKKMMFRLDTGADMTVIPFHILDELSAPPHGRIVISDYDSHTIRTQYFVVNLRLSGVLFENIHVAPAHSDSALLGVDILNQLKLTLDGPNKSLIIH